MQSCNHAIVFLFNLLFTSGLYAQNIDIEALRTLNFPEERAVDDFSRFISGSEIFISAGIPAGIAAAALISEDKDLFREACVIAAASAVTFGISTALKYSINRDRPFEKYADITKKMDVISPSFPSGHTSAAFSTATSVSLSYPEWYFIVPSYLWAGAVAYSRMELGVHYPSDVLAGAVLGAGTAFLSFKINEKLNRSRKFKPCDCP
jgi:membrane-associated phospholipid phosphatase